MLLKLLNRAADRIRRRPPDFVIGGQNAPYLLRWWVIPRSRLFNIYLHEFRRSDDDRALHDHPWVNCSVLLAGEYLEHTILAGGVNVRRKRSAGALVLRRPKAAHRIELIGGQPCITLFITGPKVRSWGFHCPKGWVPWQRFTAASDPGAIGPGCGDGDHV